MNEKKEVTVIIDNERISIQGAGIADKQEDAKNVLQSALDAMKEKRPDEKYTNEIAYKG